jgi:hypothetical protein
MAENEQTKVCPLCAETIKAAARVCPHCRYWQKQWSFRSPAVSVIFFVAVCFVVLFYLDAFYGQLFGQKRDFTPYQNQITIVNSETSFRIANSNLMVSVIGVVTNQTAFGWKNIGMEAQFLDGNGKMIDVIVADGGYWGFTVLPHSEASFKIEGRAIREEQEYKSTKDFVRTGKDIATLFDD